jgi:hypothetical protein
VKTAEGLVVANDPPVAPSAPQKVAMLKAAFSFMTFTNWVNTARKAPWPRTYICADQKGRICRIGADFMRARDEREFPVTVYEVSHVE